MKKLIFILFLSVIVQVGYSFTSIQEQLSWIKESDFKKIELFSTKQVSPSYIGLENYVSRFDLVQTEPTQLIEIANSSQPIQFQIPINGTWKTIYLIRNNSIKENLILTSQNENGQQPFSYKFGSYYLGQVEGMQNSVVAISFFEQDIIGLIVTDEGNFVIGKSNKFEPIKDEYIVYNDKDLLVKDITSCAATDQKAPKLNEPFEIPISVETYSTKCAKIYFECDFKTYQDFGSNLTSTTNYVTGLFNLVSTLYLNDSILTSISQINIWTTTDPYAGQNSTSNMLTVFSTQMSNNGFIGDLAHLLSTRAVGGGIAWLDVFCASNYYKTAVSGSLSTSLTPLPTFSWNAEVVTHELGHNMGSPHTHACAWNGNNTRIDNCGGNYNVAYQEGTCNSFPPNPVGGGTIMSYCHLIGGIGINFNLGFGSQPRTLIKTNVNTAPCLTTCIDCDGGLTITGAYSTPLTESSTSIQSIGQTTISSTSSVKLDADPGNGYILFAPASASDYLIAAPSNTTAQFVVQAYNGCTEGTPSKPNAEMNEQNLIVNSINEFSAYPNPAFSILNITHSNLKNASVHFSVLSIEGKALFNQQVMNFNSEFTLNVSALPSGFYILKITALDKTQMIKFLKD
jgi:hypothetical protein